MADYRQPPLSSALEAEVQRIMDEWREEWPSAYDDRIRIVMRIAMRDALQAALTVCEADENLSVEECADAIRALMGSKDYDNG